LGKKSITQIVIVCIVALVALAFFFPLHFIDDWTDAVLLWNSHEAYLFAGLTRHGYHLTAFQSVLALIPGLFGASRPADDDRSFTLVFHITPTGIKEYVIPDQVFQAYIPTDNTVYAWDGGPLWKWVENHFERASQEEQERIVGNAQQTMLSSGKDFSDSNGWSARHSLTSWRTESQIMLGGTPIQFFMKLADSNNDVSLDAQLPGHAPERLLHARSKLHFVSGDEYAHTFRKTDANKAVKN
jgi:hypothetical protein